MARGQRNSTLVTLPPATGGWNTRDPLAAMSPQDAIVLDNMVPGIGAVSMRKGYISHVTGLGTYIESMMVHSAPNGTDTMFAATPTAIYNVTTLGAVGAAAVSTLSNGRWQHCMFGTAAGDYLVIANGADAVRIYDGTSWTTPTITGVASSSLISVTPHVGRLWFVENNTLNAWYLPVSAIAGAAVQFPLAQFCKLGGYLLAIGSWSVDGGAGSNDNAVFITSKGEVIIYQGSDPASSTTWSLVGVFRIAEPIGRRCIAKAGADLAIVTSIGIVPLSQVLSLNLSAQTNATFSSKISPSFALAYKVGGAYQGWQLIEYPRSNLIICNVPIAERNTQHQYIANTQTGAWARWKNINAGAWALMGSDLYFGGNLGTVYKFDVEYRDDTQNISIAVQTAFSNFGVVGKKRFLAARPLVSAPYGYVPSVEVRVDYDTSAVSLPATTAVSPSSLWGVALWNVALWDPVSVAVSAWQGVSGIGQVGSIAISTTMSQAYVINQTDVLFEQGNYL